MDVVVHKDDLIESVVLPHVAAIEAETDPEVRSKVVELVVDLAEMCTSDHFFRLLDVVKKVSLLFCTRHTFS